MSKQSKTSTDLPRSLTDRVFLSTVWIAAARIFVRFLGLINTIILARLLVPEDFGLVAIAVTVMQLLENISDIGVSKTVVKYRTSGRDQYNTLFTISVARGVFISLLLVALSFVADNFYDDPRASLVFLGISLAPLFRALINPRFYEFERALDFSKEFWISASHKIVGVIVSVVIALIFRTYWAIILGIVSGTFARMAISWCFRANAPRFSLAALREIGGFTGWLTGVSFVAALNNKLDVLILGKFVSPASLGAFFVGGSIASVPRDEMAGPLVRAIYPGLAERQDHPESMRSGFLRGAEALAFVAMPAAFGLSFVANDLVRLVLGGGWTEAALMIQYFAPATGVAVLYSASNAYAMAAGKARLLFIRESLFFLIRMPLFIAGAVLYGLVGAIAACSVALLINTALNAGLYARLSGGPFYEPVWRARRSIAGVAVMTAYFLFIRPVFGGMEAMSLMPRLLIDVIMGAGLFIVVTAGLWLLEKAPDGVEKELADRLRKMAARPRSTS